MVLRQQQRYRFARGYFAGFASALVVASLIIFYYSPPSLPVGLLLRSSRQREGNDQVLYSKSPSAAHEGGPADTICATPGEPFIVMGDNNKDVRQRRGGGGEEERRKKAAKDIDLFDERTMDQNYVLDIVNDGFDRGNYLTLTPDYWLEVADTDHRYGSDLTLYYDLWRKSSSKSKSRDGVDFFTWLDVKPLPELPDELSHKPGTDLEEENVDYNEGKNDFIEQEAKRLYAVSIQVDDRLRAILIDPNGERVDTNDTRWCFVLRDNVLYGHPKVRKPGHYFQHTSFFGGRAVQMAGHFITGPDGELTLLNAASGHYKPRERDMQLMLHFLKEEVGVNLYTFHVETMSLPYFRHHKVRMKAANFACAVGNYLANTTDVCKSQCPVSI